MKIKWIILLVLMFSGAISVNGDEPEGIVYFFRYDYRGGYTGKNGWDAGADNGKVFLNSAVIGSVGYRGVVSNWSAGVFSYYTDISPLKQWNERYNEKNFRLRNSSIYGFISLPSWNKSDSLTMLTIGRKSIKLNPPEFDSSGIDPLNLAEEEKRFNDKNKDWGRDVFDKNGLGIGLYKFETKFKDDITTKNLYGFSQIGLKYRFALLE